MTWSAPTVRLVVLLTLLGGSWYPPMTRARTPSSPPPGPTAVHAALRTLLDTVAQGPASTYAHLGLLAGPGVQTFYAGREYAPCWTRETGWNPRARQALDLLRRAADVGLLPERYAWATLQALPDSIAYAAPAVQSEQLARLELRLTDALLRYTHHLRHGYLHPETRTPTTPTGSSATSSSAQHLHHALQAPDLAEAFRQAQPTTRGYRLLQAAWVRALHASPADSVRLLRDTTAGFRRVALNLERLRWAAPADSEYLVVNIPAYRLQFIRHNRVVFAHRVVVGKPESPTPVLSSRVASFVTAPEWRVPYSIAVQEILPALRRDPGFLAAHQYRLYNWRNQRISPWHVNWQALTPTRFPYTIRQQAGPTNALGRVVFYFPNQQIVFLHDTPGRAAFSHPNRALSHGCVRVENPVHLATYLLRRENRTSELPDLYRSIRHYATRSFELRRSLPIHLRYYTCETDNGQLVFLPDIYHLDPPLATALLGPVQP